MAITEEMTAGDLHDCLMEKGADLLLRTVEAIEAGDYPLQEQHVLLNGREPIHAPKIFKEDMKIDWAKPLEVLYNHIRGLAPFPAAWTELRHRVSGTVVALKVFKSERIACEHNYRVGEIVAHGGKSFEVYVHGGILRILGGATGRQEADDHGGVFARIPFGGISNTVIRFFIVFWL